MDRKNVVTAVHDLTEAVRLLEYHLGHDAGSTVIFLHYRLIKWAMKQLDTVMEAGVALETPPRAGEGE